jgi:exodeoxyribonuclease VII small subunit
MTDKPVSELSFEDALSELDNVVRRLEQGQVALTESINLYERGAALKARCEDALKAAEEKVATIRFDTDGAPTGTQLVTDL